MDLDNTDRFKTRLKRYMQVTSAAGKIGTKVALDKLLNPNGDQKELAIALKEILGHLKGPLMKIAQILATVPDMLPPEFIEEFTQLQANAPPMGWLFVKRRMATELGSKWQEYFRSFSKEAYAAASLGQVHKAETLEGNIVACKLQYPDMLAAVTADLQQLKILLSVYESVMKALDTTAIQEEIANHLYQELDYEWEAQQLVLFQFMHQNETFCRIPKVFPHLSTKRLLTMEWLDGRPVQEVKKENQDYRNRVAANIFMAWYKPLYSFGVLHGDPHLGNYKVHESGCINLFDFGCTRIFEPKFILAVIRLYESLKYNDESLALEAYKVWGFEKITKEVLEILNLWARFLYAPLLEDRVKPLQENNSGVYGKEVANKVHTELRRLGGVKPPREFVLMDRAAVGIGSVCMILGAELNWHQMFEALIHDCTEEKIQRAQKEALAFAQLPPVL